MILSSPGTLVLLRHGESEFNLKNVFAGWVDTPLTAKGRQQAHAAGVALRDDAFVPDVVYTSSLVRSIDTAEKALEAMGMPAVKIVQKKELLERHYGAMTGMNKKEAETTLGQEMFKKYRRSYDTPPPAMDASHPYHPDNPTRQAKVIAMPESGTGSESLADVVKRVKPLWEKELKPLLLQGKNLLIVAHGNSLRALNMIVANMTPEQVADYELHNAVPVVLKIAAQ